MRGFPFGALSSSKRLAYTKTKRPVRRKGSPACELAARCRRLFHRSQRNEWGIVPCNQVYFHISLNFVEMFASEFLVHTTLHLPRGAGWLGDFESFPGTRWRKLVALALSNDILCESGRSYPGSVCSMLWRSLRQGSMPAWAETRNEARCEAREPGPRRGVALLKETSPGGAASSDQSQHVGGRKSRWPESVRIPAIGLRNHR